MVALEPVLTEAEQAQAETELAAAGKGRLRHRGRADEALLRELIERHLRFTGRTLALAMLDDWEATRAQVRQGVPATSTGARWPRCTRARRTAAERRATPAEQTQNG